MYKIICLIILLNIVKSLDIYGLFPLSDNNDIINHIGQEYAAAAYLAADHYNISLNIMNTKNDLTYTINNIKNVANSSTIFIGPYNADITRQIYLLYKPKLIVTYGQPVDRMYSNSLNNVCYLAPEYYHQAQAIINIAAFYKWENVAILSDVDSTAILSAFDQSSEKNNIRISYYGIFHSEKTLYNAINGILSNNCRIIILHCSEKWTSLILKKAYELQVSRYTGYVFLSTSNIINSISKQSDSFLFDLSIGMIGIRYRYNTFENDLWLNNYQSLQDVFNTTFTKSINDYTSYAYDSIVAIHLANEDNILNNDINTLTYNGVSNHVQFDSLCYRVPNFDIVHVKDNIDHVGQWYADDTSVKSNGHVDMNGEIIFFGSQTEVPSDRFETIASLSNTVIWLTIVFVIICSLFSCFISYSVVKFASDAYIKATAPVLTHLLVVGTFIMYGSVLVWTTANDTFSSCHLPPLLWSVSFSFTILTLTLKSHRIYRIFFGKLKQKSDHIMKDTDIIKLVLLIGFFDLLFWSLLYAISPATKVKIYATSNASVFCHFSNITWVFIILLIIVPKFIIFIIGLLLSYRIRHVPNNFNESKLMALTLFMELIIYSIVSMLYLLLRTVDRNASHLVVALGLCIAMFVLLFTHNFPRLWIVRQKKRRLRKTSLYAHTKGHRKKPTRQDIVSYSRRHVRCLNCGTPVNKEYIQTLLSVMEDPINSASFESSNRNRAASAPDNIDSNIMKSESKNNDNDCETDNIRDNYNSANNNNDIFEESAINNNYDNERLWSPNNSTNQQNDSEIFLSDEPIS